MQLLILCRKQTMAAIRYLACATFPGRHSAKPTIPCAGLPQGNPGIRTLQEAEPIGPKGYLDVMVIAPCTGNSAAKLANAITDTPVLMAAKAHMRNGKPLVIAISTNDALGASFKNIGMLMNTKHIYFVPFAQDNYEKKPNSMVAKMELLPETISAALEGKQLQPVVRG